MLLSSRLIAGDPIPGIDITVDQTPHGVKQGTTGKDGTLILSGLQAGPCEIIIRHGEKVLRLEKSEANAVRIPGKQAKGNIKPIRLELADKAAPTPKLKTTPANHNTTRSNRLQPKVADTDGGTPEIKALPANHNTTRSNKTHSVATDDGPDCQPVIEILPMAGGHLSISAHCR